MDVPLRIVSSMAGLQVIRCAAFLNALMLFMLIATMHKMIGTTDRLEGGVLVGVQGPWLLVGCTTPIPWPGINNYRVNTVIVLLMQPPPQILKGLGVIFLRPLLGHQNEMP